MAEKKVVQGKCVEAKVNPLDREDFQELLKIISVSKGYMVGVTVLNEKNQLEHFLLSENFPKVEFLKSVKKIKELIINELEQE